MIDINEMDLNLNISKNLVEAKEETKRLRSLVEKQNKEWHSAKISPPDNKYENEYVLVKIRALGKGMRPIGPIFSVPYIAEFRGTCGWYTQEMGLPYGTEIWPYEVVLWKPIPGEEVIDGRHEY